LVLATEAMFRHRATRPGAATLARGYQSRSASVSSGVNSDPEPPRLSTVVQAAAEFRAFAVSGFSSTQSRSLAGIVGVNGDARTVAVMDGEGRVFVLRGGSTIATSRSASARRPSRQHCDGPTRPRPPVLAGRALFCAMAGSLPHAGFGLSPRRRTSRRAHRDVSSLTPKTSPPDPHQHCVSVPGRATDAPLLAGHRRDARKPREFSSRVTADTEPCLPWKTRATVRRIRDEGATHSSELAHLWLAWPRAAPPEGNAMRRTPADRLTAKAGDRHSRPRAGRLAEAVRRCGEGDNLQGFS